MRSRHARSRCSQRSPRGCPTQQIAERFVVSENTIRTHVVRIFAKLDLRDRAQAVVLAYETGLIVPGKLG